MPAPKVEDRDQGFKALKVAAATIDGLELRVGILDWRLRYPKSKASGKLGTEIAKVAGIHGLYKVFAAISDSTEAERNTAMGRIADAVNKGKTGLETLIHETMGVPLREAFRQGAGRVLKFQTGRLREAIRSTVFDGVRIGRGPAYRGKVAAGDKPSQPRPTQKTTP